MDYVLTFDFTAENWRMLLAGAGNTILFSITGMLIGLAIGIMCAIWKVGKNRPLKWLATIYVEAIRNTPILIQLLFIYFGMPSLGIRLDPNATAIVALIFNFGAYATEIVRAGIEATPRGQIEAAESLGLRRWEIYAHVVILPALERVYPALTSQFTLLMLGTSIVSAIGAEELTSAANTVQSVNFRSFEVYMTASAMYLGLTLIFRTIFIGLGSVLFPRRRAVNTVTREALYA